MIQAVFIRLARIILGAALLLSSVLHAHNIQLDPAFSIPVIEDAGATRRPLISALPDGGVLVVKADSHDYVNARRTSAIARLNRDGTLDASYVTPVFRGYPRVACVYPDGRVLVVDVATYNSSLMRLLANGAMDPSFEQTPVYTSTGYSVHAALCADGRIWVWGDVSFEGRSDVAVTLLNANGGFDRRFAVPSDTKVYLGYGDAAVQPDGKLVAAGSLVLPGDLRLGIFRLNLDGSADPTFKPAGDLPIGVVAVLPDGKILAGSQSGFVRLFPDGKRDESYRAMLASGAFMPRVGRATGSGAFYYHLGGVSVDMRRLNPDGTPDSGFSVLGDDSAMLDYMGGAQGFPSSWDDRTLYFANAVTTERLKLRATVTRITSSGAIDSAFTPRISIATAVNLFLQEDGKYLVAGLFDYLNGASYQAGRVALARVNADGSLDTGFKASNTINYSGNPWLGVQADGKIIVRGGPSNLYRLNSDGSRDETFAPMEVEGNGSMDSQGRLYAISASGKIVRYLANGTPDASFVAATATPMVAPMATIDGKVIGVVYDNSYGRKLIRFLSDGRVDASYAEPTIDSASVTMLSDGSVLSWEERSTAAPITSVARICRYDLNGAKVFACEVPRELASIASAIHTILSGSKLTRASVNLAGIGWGGGIEVRGDEITLVPNYRDTAYADAMPFGRYRLREPGQPAYSMAPEFYLSPKSQVVPLGKTVNLAAQVYGQAPFTCQWFRNGVSLGEPSLSQSTYVWRDITNFQATDAGDYTVVIANATGVATSAIAHLEYLPKPVITASPRSITVTPGQTVALTISHTGQATRAGWTIDGRGYGLSGPEVTGNPYTVLLENGFAVPSGVYRCSLGNASGSVAAEGFTVTVSSTAAVGRMANLSVRTHVGTGDQNLIVGFVISEGSTAGRLPLLIRSAGPTLAGFGVANVLSDPLLVLRLGDTEVASNDDWMGDAQIGSIGASLGAFPFAGAASKDAALYQPSLSAGAYTAQVAGARATTGTALAEIYDATPADAPATGARLVNVSCRALVGADGEALMLGFVIGGETAKTVLVRGLGQSLRSFGVANALTAGELTIVDMTGAKVAENLAANADGIVDYVARKVGAVAAPAGSSDNAIVITLPPGIYTAQLRGASGASGVALIELYEVP